MVPEGCCDPYDESQTKVEFICANADSQALENAKGATILKLGGGMTKGPGAGANPEVGRQAAERERGN